ncbi:MAG: hypothetical protein MZW92_09940 [Comamonadaceae bacterium]|nr:hypothetical protein [Comamonadaceae bacterium]
MRGIGWVVLYEDPTNGRLINFWINEHDVSHPAGCAAPAGHGRLRARLHDRLRPEAGRLHRGLLQERRLGGRRRAAQVRARPALLRRLHSHGLRPDRGRAGPSAQRPAGQRARPFVVYWMQAAQRAAANHALEYAARAANELRQAAGRPVRPDRRLSRGQRPALRLHARGPAGDARGPAAGAASRWSSGSGDPAAEAAAFGRDGRPDGRRRRLRPGRAGLAPGGRGRSRVPPGRSVATNVVVPVETASPKEEYAAATLRPKIYRLARPFPGAPPGDAPAGHAGRTRRRKRRPRRYRPPSWPGSTVDRSVGPSPVLRGGPSEAARRLRGPSSPSKLAAYAEDRNDPSLDGASGLSPYLHFGQISPLAVALAVKKGPAYGRAPFLEELIVRRELVVQLRPLQPGLRPLRGPAGLVPGDAPGTRPGPRPYPLHAGRARGRRDPRSLLERGPAGDGPDRPDAQLHAHVLGQEDPRVVGLAPDRPSGRPWPSTTRYALDGRDPNSFAGVAWAFGKHDRPWGRRPVFGTVRYMNAAGLRRKFDIDAYVRRDRSPRRGPDRPVGAPALENRGGQRLSWGNSGARRMGMDERADQAFRQGRARRRGRWCTSGPRRWPGPSRITVIDYDAAELSWRRKSAHGRGVLPLQGDGHRHLDQRRRRPGRLRHREARGPVRHPSPRPRGHHDHDPAAQGRGPGERRVRRPADDRVRERRDWASTADQLSLILGPNYRPVVPGDAGRLPRPGPRAHPRRQGPHPQARPRLPGLRHRRRRRRQLLLRPGEDRRADRRPRGERSSPSPGRELLHEIHALKREMIDLRKVGLAAARGRQRPRAPGDARSSRSTTGVFLRDVYDHAVQVIDTRRVLPGDPDQHARDLPVERLQPDERGHEGPDHHLDDLHPHHLPGRRLRDELQVHARDRLALGLPGRVGGRSWPRWAGWCTSSDARSGCEPVSPAGPRQRMSAKLRLSRPRRAATATDFLERGHLGGRRPGLSPTWRAPPPSAPGLRPRRAGAWPPSPRRRRSAAG